MTLIRRRAAALVRVAVEEHHVAVFAARPFLLDRRLRHRLMAVDADNAKTGAECQQTRGQTMKVPPAGSMPG